MADNMYRVTAEIFAAGKWNGYKFTEQDLHEIANNFNILHANHKVPLKFGHNDEQKMTDGYPALGWVDKVWVDDGMDGKKKLMAEFSDVPEIVYKAMSKMRYRKVSIELAVGVKQKDNGKERVFKYVLSGVALLGADLPAVSTLADLHAYMSEEEINKLVLNDLEFKQCLSFSMYEEESSMDEKDKELAEMKLKMSQLESAQKDKDREIAEFKRKEDERIALEQKQKVEFKRKEVNDLLETAVKEKKMLPAEREKLVKLFGIDNDDRVVDINIDDVKALLSTKGANFSSQQQGKGDMSNNGDDRVYQDPGEELDRLANIKMSANPQLDYMAALTRAMRENPELAKEHIVDEKVY